MTTAAPTDAVTAALLRQLFDDAGLFPPASLSLDAALRGHAESRRSTHSWMLGRFVCPAARLAEIPPGIRVSVIVSSAADLPARPADVAATVEAVECRPGTVDVDRLVGAARDLGVTDVFVEVAPTAADVASLAGTGAGAKIRCGGETAADVPTPVALADALTAAAHEGVRVKATAGLHHPFRAHRPGDGFATHGFLNLLAAMAAAMAGADQATVLDVLEEQRPGAFSIGPGGFGWQQWTVDAAGARRLRTAHLAGIGSCSFCEPVEDLVALGALT